MLDFTHIPNKAYTQIFYAQSRSNSWQTWQKPRGAKMIQIFCLGGGGGGAGGAAITNARGNGGGGSGAFVKGIFGASTIPDILYILTGAGGTGGLGGTTGNIGEAGGSGAHSYVTVTPNTGSASGILLVSSTVVATGGISLGAYTGTTKGAGATSALPANMPLSNLGIINIVAGVDSVNANYGSTPADITPTTIVTPGASSNGSNNNTITPAINGSILPAGPMPYIRGGISGSVADPTLNGGNGVAIYSPIMCFTGGAAGAASKVSTVVGGNGGNGSYGCGGGAGGNPNFSTNGIQGGNGGNGGDGLVIITTSI
jgi:hypothetical protein